MIPAEQQNGDTGSTNLPAPPVPAKTKKKRIPPVFESQQDRIYTSIREERFSAMMIYENFNGSRVATMTGKWLTDNDIEWSGTWILYGDDMKVRPVEAKIPLEEVVNFLLLLDCRQYA